MGDPLKEGHRALGEVGSLGYRRLVVDLEQDLGKPIYWGADRATGINGGR